MKPSPLILGATAFVALAWPALAQADDAPQAPKSCRAQPGQPAAPYQSVEQLPDGRVTFRICAPDANALRVVSVDNNDAIPFMVRGVPPGLAMTRDDTGLWSATTAVPVAPDSYRFNFSVDGARVPDPRATRFSEERTGVNSVFETTGPEGAFQAWDKDVPHGAVTVVEYWSNSFGAKRRAHIYTPPGYMKGSQKYPVLYLVHGGGDSDDSWTSVGRAHNILDNLIAAGRAKPMIIVMPFGHSPEPAPVNTLPNTAFGDDLTKDLIPYVERTFRVVADADHRGMAGLSMGGAHTLNFGLPRPDLFHYIGVFSMGLGMGNNTQQIADYEARNGAALKRGAKDFRLVYYAIGKDDFLQPTVRPTRAIFEQYGIKYVYNESPGGHTWINWRRYLNDFAPQLFR